MQAAQAITLQKLADFKKVKCNHIVEITKSMKYIHNKQSEEKNVSKIYFKENTVKQWCWTGTWERPQKSPLESLIYVL